MSAHHESIATDNYGIEFQMGDFRMGRFMVYLRSIQLFKLSLFNLCGFIKISCHVRLFLVFQTLFIKLREINWFSLLTIT